MGLRHLILVRYRGKWQIAQYGQWEGNPEGQGACVLAFLQDRENGEPGGTGPDDPPAQKASEAVGEQGRNIAALKVSLDKNLLYLPSQQELDKFWEDADHISTQARRQMDEENKQIQDLSDESLNALWSPMMLVQPSLCRNASAQILSLVAYTKDRIAIRMKTEFIMDPMCHWAYVVDLDKETFEVYSGLISLVDGEPDPRWENEQCVETQGLKPRLIVSFAFENLKNLNESRFVDSVNKKYKEICEEEEEEELEDEDADYGSRRSRKGKRKGKRK